MTKVASSARLKKKKARKLTACRKALPKSAVFRSELRLFNTGDGRVVRRGFGYVCDGVQLPGLTHPTLGFLAQRFYPGFDPAAAVPIPASGSLPRGIPLKTTDFVPGPGTRGLHKQSDVQRMRTGRTKGNLLVKQLRAFVSLVARPSDGGCGLPMSEFSVVQRQKRRPQIITAEWLQNKKGYLSRGDPVAVKRAVALLNSHAIHVQMLAQKLIELQLEPVGYEIPVWWPRVRLGQGEPEDGFWTGLDLLCVHTPTGLLVPIEIKTGTDEYYLHQPPGAKGSLRKPFEQFPNCVLSQYLLQTLFSSEAFRRTFRHLAAKTTVPLLIRLSRMGAWHYVLPKALLACLPS